MGKVSLSKTIPCPKTTPSNFLIFYADCNILLSVEFISHTI